ncbi:Cbb3-type cytochrome c oxidase subunit CcoP [Rubrivivax sp. A210]|uniref:cytochrome-c oxidase, cbb3-type subunit III n=1 Tax=Rubrivivax sp. A210 TaxID=2772301 RepID=UPI001919B18D|nr:cytochrome-c oxidase, cbb3-type subunit III [Rubrivivax sp. A210]CAD5365884.1 Cbb3-type cytochrome c oxidase subunit CcoP [Rubrivivax sp. A210]
MSDFVSSGWALFVAAVTVLSLVFCLVLLVIASRRKVMANDNTTGHVWDVDLQELNNPLPRWWMWLFVATVVFAAVYLAFYPGLGTNAGSLGWTSRGQFEAEQEKARAALEPVYAKFTAMSAEQLGKDAQAMGIGQRLFLNNCAQCHGSDARGSKGFPNLADSDWLGAGTPEYIGKVIAEGRTGMMPPMAAAVGTSEDVKNVAHYVLSLSGSAHNDVAAQLGKAKFGACAACHGPDGKGMAAIGAPNLTDKTWLHGWGEPAIVAMVTGGKTNVMPAQGRLLTPAQIHVLSAYVWNLSQGTRVAGN